MKVIMLPEAYIHTLAKLNQQLADLEVDLAMAHITNGPYQDVRIADLEKLIQVKQNRIQKYEAIRHHQ